MARYTNKHLIEGIKERNNEVLEFMYDRYYPMIRHLILQNNGSEAEAREVFQEAMVVVFEKLRSKSFRLSCSLKTFLYSVARNIWLQQLERNGRQVAFEDVENQLITEGEAPYDDDLAARRHLYQRHFMRLSESCRKILKLFLASVGFEEIRRIMGFRSRQYAVKRKYDCVKILFRSIQDDPEYKKLSK